MAESDNGDLFIVNAHQTYSGGSRQVWKLSDSVLSLYAGSGSEAFRIHPDGTQVLQVGFQHIRQVRWHKGYLYIADQQALYRVDGEGLLLRIAGGDALDASFTEELPARDVRIGSIGAFDFDEQDRIYLYDAGRRVVWRIGTDRRLAHFAGGGAPPGYDQPAREAQLGPLTALAAGPGGNLYLADLTSIRVVAPDGVIRMYSGKLESRSAPAGDYGPVDEATWDSIRSMTTLLDGSLLVFNTYPAGFRRLGTDGIVYPLLKDVASVSVIDVTALEPRRAGGFYFGGSGSTYSVDEEGQLVRLTGGGAAIADGAPAALTAMQPAGFSLRPGGGAVISDLLTNRLLALDDEGRLRTLAGNDRNPGGSINPGKDGDPGPRVGIYPQAVAAAGDGTVYFVDGFVLRAVSPDGFVTTLAGRGNSGLDEGMPGNALKSESPIRGLAAGAEGSVFFTVGSGSAGALVERKPDGRLHIRHREVNNAPIAPGPGGGWMTVGIPGVVEHMPDGDRRRLDTEKRVLPAFYSIPETEDPRSAAVDGQGRVWFSTANRILLIDGDGFERTVAGVVGTVRPDGLPDEVELRWPAHLQFDAAGDLWFTVEDGVMRLKNPSACRSRALPLITSNSTGDEGWTNFIAPGLRVTIRGVNLGPPRRQVFTPDERGEFPVSAGGVSVRFGGQLAPLVEASLTSTTVVVPYETLPGGAVTVETAESSREVFDYILEAARPYLRRDGVDGQTWVVNEDGSLNSPENPAAPGSVVAVQITGAGQTSPPGITGRAGASPLPEPAVRPSATLQFQPAEIVTAVAEPGTIGLVRVMVRIPPSAQPAPDAGLSIYFGERGSWGRIAIR
ncbi:MAG: hypothetical protein M9913_09485 [Bryobacteraceae bacterium]|nr:hypothetical protein [Bryobacteraceae bacterium]